MDKEKVYWFITVFNYDDWGDMAHITSSRCWGFYTDKSIALEVLHNNMTDIYEFTYPCAILEPYHEGISGYDFEESRQFFKYDEERNGYFEIEEPRCFKHSVGFGLG